METLRAASPVRVGDVTLVPVERAGIRSEIGDTACWLSAVKEPYAVVVCDARGVRAIGVDSFEIPLDDLIQETPNLAAVLAELSAP